MQRLPATLARLGLFAVICAASLTPVKATTGIIVRSRYRIVLAADSRAVYRLNAGATECKLFQVGDTYATVSGLARYGRSYRVTDSISQGFAGAGSFQSHVAATAYVLQRTLQQLLAGLQVNNPSEYRYLMQRSVNTSDFVQLALAQTVRSQPMLGIIELRLAGIGNGLTVKTTICPGNCRQDTSLFYLGYWDRIQPHVASSGRPRSVGSAASIDQLIRMEINAHPAEVGAPINILELNSSGARWLQNGGNCSLPGVGW